MQEITTTTNIDIKSKIYMIRNTQVMLDRDLAELYGVETKVFNQAIKRNIERFPENFRFQLTQEEYEILRSQIVTLRHGEHSKYLPYAFTDNGLSMLSSVLNSPLAIRVNRQIMRYINKIRKLELSNDDFRKYIEAKMDLHDEKLKKIDISLEVIFSLFDSFKKSLALPQKTTGKYGFRKNEEKKGNVNSKNRKLS